MFPQKNSETSDSDPVELSIRPGTFLDSNANFKCVIKLPAHRNSGFIAVSIFKWTGVRSFTVWPYLFNRIVVS